MRLMYLLSYLVGFIYSSIDKFILQPLFKCRLGYCGKNVIIRHVGTYPTSVLSRIYLEDNTVLKSFNMISLTGRFFMKKNSGAAANLTIITGNHHRRIGKSLVDSVLDKDLDEENDVIVEEDVWIGANVTLLAGVKIGRGSTIGAGSVCLKSVPPYSIVMGNPAKIVGFNFNPEQILEHEKALYAEEEHIPLETLENNYKKYFLDRISEIKSFTKL